MQLGMIGLGRMGASLVRRLTKDGHKCMVYDVSAAAVKKLAGRGIRGTASIDELIAKMAKPRAVWVMVPAGVTGKTVDALASRMEAGDIIIDGGNSYYRDDLARAKALEASGIHYVDCGTSGGVFGLARGYCLMIGGEAKVVKHLEPIFKSIAPGVEAAALFESPGLKNYAGRVSDSGEGRWTIAAAIDEAVPAPVLGAALFERFSSRGNADFANRVLSAIRKQFGGHDEKKKGGS